MARDDGTPQSVPESKTSKQDDKGKDNDTVASLKTNASSGTIKTETLEPDLNPPVVRIQGYKIGELLGIGQFSKVYRARKKNDMTGTSEEYAVKVIMDYQDQPWWPQLNNELKISIKLEHPNVVKVYRVIKTKHRAFIFMDLAKTTLEKEIAIKKLMKEDEARKLFKQIVQGVKYIHGATVAHRGK